MTHTDRHGRFTIGGLVAGEYSVSCYDEGLAARLEGVPSGSTNLRIQLLPSEDE